MEREAASKLYRQTHTEEKDQKIRVKKTVLPTLSKPKSPNEFKLEPDTQVQA